MDDNTSKKAGQVMFGGESSSWKVTPVGPANPGLALWNQLRTPDPAFSHDYPKGGMKLTSTDATWIVRRMTELFGPPRYIEPTATGQDHANAWGFSEVEHILEGMMFLSKVRVWVFYEGVVYTAEHWGGWELLDHKSRPDADCAKKAFTDGLTKALSYLGMAADNWLETPKRGKRVVKEPGEREYLKKVGAAIKPEPLAEMEAELAKMGTDHPSIEAPLEDTTVRDLNIVRWGSGLLENKTIRKIETLHERASEIAELFAKCDEKGTPVHTDTIKRLREIYRARAQELGNGGIAL